MRRVGGGGDWWGEGEWLGLRLEKFRQRQLPPLASKDKRESGAAARNECHCVIRQMKTSNGFGVALMAA